MKDSTSIKTRSGLTFTADVAGPIDGPLVLLLHGFPESRHSWRAALPSLAAAGYRAVAPDQRGYTPGVRPGTVEAYSTARLVADILDLADALRAERFHLVGHDWGGQGASLTAAEHPERLRSLAVLSRPSKHHRAMTPELTDRWWADDRAALRAIFDHAGVPAPDADAYVATFAERAALDAAEAAAAGTWEDAECVIGE